MISYTVPDPLPEEFAQLAPVQPTPAQGQAESEPAKRKRGRPRKVQVAEIADPARRKFSVRLRDNKTLEVLAASREEAIERYKEMCGILHTIHQFHVEEVGGV